MSEKEEEDFLLEIAWRNHDNNIQRFNAIETQAQIIMVADGILLSLLIEKVPPPSIISLPTLLISPIIVSFLLALFVNLNPINAIDPEGIDLTQTLDETGKTNLKLVKLITAQKINAHKKRLIEDGKWKPVLYNYSILLFIISIGFILARVLGFW